MFYGKYQDLKLTQKLIAGQTGYHGANTVVPTTDIGMPMAGVLRSVGRSIHLKKGLERIKR